MEKTVAVDSGASVKVRRDGEVDYVDASRIIVNVDEKYVGDDSILGLIFTHLQNIHELIKILVSIKDLVKPGDKVLQVMRLLMVHLLILESLH